MTAPRARRFQPDDGPGCWAVFVDAVRVGARDHYSPAELADWLPDDTYPDGYADWLAGKITFVAGDGDQITGFMMMHHDGYLDLAFVLARCRRTGLAALLYTEILAEARRLGLPRLTVKASRLAERFFARAGWQPMVDPDGAPLDDGMSRHMDLYL